MYTFIAVAVMERGVSRTYCLAVILVFHGEWCRLYGYKITKISSFCFSFVCFFRPYLFDGGLHLLAVDVDGKKSPCYRPK